MFFPLVRSVTQARFSSSCASPPALGVFRTNAVLPKLPLHISVVFTGAEMMSQRASLEDDAQVTLRVGFREYFSGWQSQGRTLLAVLGSCWLCRAESIKREQNLSRLDLKYLCKAALLSRKVLIFLAQSLQRRRHALVLLRAPAI